MSQATKITKFQNGGVPGNTLSFKLNGEMIDIPETELNDMYVEYRNSLGSKGKNAQDWNKDYTDFVTRVKSGQQNNQFYELKTGAGETVSAQTNVPGSNADLGLNSRGNTVKQGMFSGIAGVTNEARRDAHLVGALGSWLDKKKQANVLLAEEDKIKSDKLSQEAADKEKARLGVVYDDFNGRLNIGQQLYGRQLNTTPEQAQTFTYSKYWAGDDASKRQSIIDYLKNSRANLGNADYATEEFRNRFKNEHGLDFDTYSKNLSSLNLDDPNLDLDKAFGSIGLESHYRALNDKNIYDSLTKAKEAAEAVTMADGFNVDEFGVKKLWLGNKPYTGISPEDSLYYKDGVLGTGQYDGFEYDFGKLREGDSGGFRWSGGKKYSGLPEQSEIDNYDYTELDNFPIYQDGVKTFAKDYLQTIDFDKLNSPIYQELEKTFGAKYDAVTGNNKFNTELLQFKGNQRSPYTENTDIKDVIESADVSDQYENLRSEAVKNGNEVKFNRGLVMEKIQDKNPLSKNKIRYRFFDKDGKDYVGHITADPKNVNRKIFVAQDDPTFQVELGAIETEALPGQKMFVYKGNKAKTQSGRVPYGYEIAKKKDKEASEKVVANKEGGVLKITKFQNGGVSERTKSNYVIDPREEYSASTTLNDPDYKMTGADYAQLTALVGDVVGLGLAFVPGANAASAATGAFGSVANYVAESEKTDSYWNKSNIGNLLLNLGLDTATLLPIAGGAAKTAKVLNGIKKMAPALSYSFGALGLVSASDALGKVMQGEDLSLEEWRQIAAGLTATVHGGKMLGQKTLGYTRNGIQNQATVNVKVGDTIQPKSVKMSENDYKEFTMLDSNSKKAEFLKQAALKQYADLKPEDIQINASDPSIKGLKFWDWKRGSSEGLDISREKRVLQPGEGSAFRRYFAKNEALTNLDAKGRDGWVGQYFSKPRTDVKPGEWNNGVYRYNDSAMPSRGSLLYPLNYKKGVSRADAFSARDAAGKTPVPLVDPNKKMPLGLPAPQPEVKPSGIRRPEFDYAADKNSRFNVAKEKAQGTTQPGSGKVRTDSVGASQTGYSVSPTRSDISTDPNSFTKRTTNFGNKSKTTFKDGDFEASFSKGGMESIRRKVFGGKGLKNTSGSSKEAEVDFSQFFKKDGSLSQKATRMDNKIRNLKSEVNKRSLQRLFEQSLQKASTNPNFKLRFAEGGKVVKAQWGTGLFKIVNDIYDVKKNPIGTAITGASKPTFNTPRNIFNTNNARTTVPIDKVLNPNKYVNNNGIYNRDGSFIAAQPKANPIPGKAAVETGSMTDLGVINNTVDTNSGKGFSVNPTLLSEFGRALFNRNVSKRMNTDVPVTLKTNPQEIYAPVKGDIMAMNAASRAGNRLRNNSRSNMTTDAGLQTAAQLAAETKANEFEYQGAMNNSNLIRQQELQNLELGTRYAAGRAATANDNMSAINAGKYAKDQAENQKMLAMNKSYDNFWANTNMMAQQKDLQNQNLYNEMTKLNLGNNRFGTDFSEQGWKNKTLDEVRQGLSTEANSWTPEFMNDPLNQEKINDFRRRSKLLEVESQKMLINSLLNKPYNDSSSLIRFSKAGSKLTLGERKELIAYGVDVRNASQWVRDYSRFMSKKMDSDTKAAMSANKSIQEIVKIALNKDK